MAGVHVDVVSVVSPDERLPLSPVGYGFGTFPVGSRRDTTAVAIRRCDSGRTVVDGQPDVEMCVIGSGALCLTGEDLPDCRELLWCDAGPDVGVQMHRECVVPADREAVSGAVHTGQAVDRLSDRTGRICLTCRTSARSQQRGTHQDPNRGQQTCTEHLPSMTYIVGRGRPVTRRIWHAPGTPAADEHDRVPDRTIPPAGRPAPYGQHGA